MKLIITLVLCFFVAVGAVKEYVNGENGWYIPHIDGSFEWMDKDVAEAKLAKYSQIEGRFSLNPVSFYLYTKSNLDTPQEISASSASVSNSYFNPKNPTRFTIHGWTSNAASNINSDVRNAWFTHGDMNIITVEWSRASLEYVSSVMAVPGVGQKTAELINFLNENHGLNLNNTIIIGHSLGAHVAGYTGKNVKNGPLNTIIGLDPASPLFDYNKPNSRLSSQDAFYVQSIQTNAGKLGFLEPIGKDAFYPNGGKKQPGCGLDLTGACSHSRSIEYYAEAVSRNDFPAIKCIDFHDAVLQSCGNTYSGIRMGALGLPYKKDGLYYVPVHSEAPYGMGA